MQRRILLTGVILLSLSAIINWGCSKLDTTDIGSDLIPAVDNVHTFADTLDITTTQGAPFVDSTIVSRTELHVLGKITNDPLFGQTTANVYMQLKPTFYPYYFGDAVDTINTALDSRTHFDSVVLCMNYQGFWGDSTQPITLEVRTVNKTNGVWDSVYQAKNINVQPTTGAVIGTKSFDVRRLGDQFYYKNKRDSASNQIRIPLSVAFMNQLLGQDTSVAGPDNGLRSDSLFKAVFNNGFAVIATNGNGLMYSSLSDTNTKLEVHYVRKHAGAIDTSYSSFKLNSTSTGTINSQGVVVIQSSSTVNNIIRNRAGYPVSSPAPNELYIQTTPGTYVNLSIPELSTWPNRIIHRAELIVEQIPVNQQLDNEIFTTPGFLYLELRDTGTAVKWKPIYYDLNPNTFYDPDYTNPGTAYFPSIGVDPFYHGGYVREKTDAFGQRIKYYNMNISRYVQHIVTNHIPNYSMRLSAPSYIHYPQFPFATYLPFNNTLAKGRVKIGGGNNPNYKMKLRIIYSNL